MTPADAKAIAVDAVRFYAETHPRPPHVTQTQAAEVLGLSRATVSRLVHAGELRLNTAGMVPIGEVDRLLATDRR
ncbi:MAG: DNA-binding protein [Rhodocyclaceae bacterium]|nr:MAG: DNA-binding protein [Rhodocyclaceae bacterium]